MTSNTQLFQRNPDILYSTIDNEIVMIDENFESYFGLHAVGAEIWNLLQTPHSIEQIADNLIERYDVSMHKCMIDLHCLFDELIANNMILSVK
ncbi:MAG: PqqD family protein [Gammaproteobacteria bacterium]|nr:PqqD family protein [Gammaproteobacteria bacterium]